MKIVFALTFIITIFCSYAQIAEKDFEKADLLEHQFAKELDSTVKLSGNCKLTYSHDSIFKCVHLTTADKKVYSVWISYIDDNTGYLTFKNDKTDYVLFELRSDGSGNKADDMYLDKKTGGLHGASEWDKISKSKKEMGNSGLLMTFALIAMIVVWAIRKYIFKPE